MQPADAGLERPLPYNLEAERGVLGAILLDNSALDTAKQKLKPEDFSEAHRYIFERMITMKNIEREIDLVTLTDELTRTGEIEIVGGSPYLAQLIDGVPRVSNVGHYADIVSEKAQLRHIIRFGHEIEQQGLEARDHPSSILRSAEEKISRLSQQSNLNSKKRIRDWTDIPGISELPETPLAWLVEGMVPRGGVILLAGESGSYKTWLALALAKGVSSGGEFLGHQCECKDVLYLDLENPVTVIRDRLAVLGVEPMDNFRIWGGWEADQPPKIENPRLLALAHARKPLIIVDSFIRFHSADENSATAMAPVMAALRTLANVGATAVLLHHRPKSESSKYRGSSDIHAGVDLAYSLALDRKDVILRLECFKNRLGAEFNLTLRPDLEVSSGFIVSQDPGLTKEREMQAQLRRIIEAEPGLTQSEILDKSGLADGRARGILLREDGKQWRSERGEHNKKLYYPLARRDEEVEVTF